jgi:hypothetical protein
MTSPAGDIGPESAPAVAPTDPDTRTGTPCPGANPAPGGSVSPAHALSRQRWSERDRRLPDDGILAPQQRYPGRIATP